MERIALRAIMGISARAISLAKLLNGEIFYTLKEAKIVIEGWRRHYNTIRPHSSLGYRPPAPEALVWPATTMVADVPALN